MAQMLESWDKTSDDSFSDRYLAEVSYRKRLAPRVVLAALPGFVFFAVFHFLRGNLFPSIIFALLTVNASVSLILGRRISDLNKLAQLNYIGLTIAFGLFALVIVSGLLSDDIYIVIPWVFTYPAIILLMIGNRTGIVSASLFCLAVAIVLIFIDLPPWTDATKLTFKLNIIYALVVLLIDTLVAERTRVKTRNDLLDARNKHKVSEKRQRQTNSELKSEIQMRIQSEQLLSESELRYRALFEESAVSLWEENQVEIKKYLDNLPQEAMEDLPTYLQRHRADLVPYVIQARVTAVNRATLKLYDAPDMRTLLDNILKILPVDLVGWAIERFPELYLKGSYQSQVETCTIHGKKLNLLLSSTIPVGFVDSWEKVYTSVYDITDRVTMEKERKRFEEQLQHTRQIQAIASLAGGIAHQFNNALAVITGSVELLELKTPDMPDTQVHFKTLKGSSERMRRLTEQLLAYARGGKYQPIDFAVNDIINNLLSSNESVAKSNALIRTKLESDVVLLQCDLTQIRIVLEAVLTNAVEATEAGGKITIEISKAHLPEDPARDAQGPAPGNYARITILDDGVGMDAETCRRVFEPFFSTKFVGRGLGMAAAYGIVHNHDGLIRVDSEPDRGTRVDIYLPCRSSLDDDTDR